MSRRIVLALLASGGLVLVPAAPTSAQYTYRSGSPYVRYGPRYVPTYGYRNYGGSQYSYTSGYTYTAPPYAYATPPPSYPNYGVHANAPSALAYSAYSFPGNYYQPTYPSYAPYSPVVGATPAGAGTPVYSITFPTPTGPQPLAQGSVGNSPGNEIAYRAGYPGHTAPSPYYSYGQGYPAGLPPSLPSASLANPSTAAPGTFGNIVTQPYTPNLYATPPPMSAGTQGFGVNPGSP